MIFITENSEQKMIDMLRNMDDTQGDYQCLSLLGREYEGVNISLWFEQLQTNIHDKNSYLFFHENGDIYLLAKGITNKVFENIKESLPQQSASGMRLRLATFNIRTDKMALMGRAGKSLREKREKDQEQRQSGKITRSADGSENLPISYDEFLQNLSSRREKRAHFVVLVVEDDPFSRTLIRSTIETVECQVVFADSAVEAVRQYILHAPDTVFLDIGLPDAPGHDVLKKIKAFDEQAYVIMLSGNCDKNNVFESVSNGAKGFVRKPFTKDRLIEYIKRCPFYTQKNQYRGDIQ